MRFKIKRRDRKRIENILGELILTIDKMISIKNDSLLELHKKEAQEWLYLVKLTNSKVKLDKLSKLISRRDVFCFDVSIVYENCYGKYANVSHPKEFYIYEELDDKRRQLMNDLGWAFETAITGRRRPEA